MKPIPVLRHVPHETLGTLADAFSAAGLAYAYVDVFRLAARLELADAPALIVLGGPMNVDETDRYPHLAAEVAWIRATVDRRLPVLGICLGAQLLAKALGARVYANAVKEIGWHEIELTAAGGNDRLFAGLPSPTTVFQWHGDTFDLPPGAVHLAQSCACRHQAFRYDSAWGLQFHIEVTATMIDAWLTEPGNCDELETLPAIDPAAIRAATPHELPKMAALGEVVLGRFAELAGCRGQRE